jgi:CspA family cold shock protein
MVLTGTVKFFIPARGFGFIISDAGGSDVFMHAADIVSRDLERGERVTYIPGLRRGRPCATQVRSAA